MSKNAQHMRVNAAGVTLSLAAFVLTAVAVAIGAFTGPLVWAPLLVINALLAAWFTCGLLVGTRNRLARSRAQR